MNKNSQNSGQRTWLAGFIISIIIVFFCNDVYSQNRPFNNLSIAGYIHDSISHEKLIGATVINTNNKKATTSNSYGFFQFNIKAEGQICLQFSHLGYCIKQICIKPGSDTIINVFLHPQDYNINEVEISADNIRHHHNGMVKIPLKTIKNVPSMFGEKDVLKTIQMLPGVQGGVEGTSGLIVRGGGPGQNMILLDDAPVYNVSHLFGFFSVFTPDALNDVKLVKGGFPARYGERVSSILDVRMKEGDNQNYHGNINIGLISMKSILEGPILKDKMSFMVSARRTMYDIILLPVFSYKEGNIKSKEGYFFYDINAKVNYDINHKNKMYMSFYSGKDKFFQKYSEIEKTLEYEKESNDNSSMGWGNRTLSLRYNKILSPKLFINHTLVYANYAYQLTNNNYYDIYDLTQDVKFKNSGEVEFTSKITDLTIKADANILVARDHKIEAGFLISHKIFSPGTFCHKESNDSVFIDQSTKNQRILSDEINPYLEYNFNLFTRFNFSLGLRIGMYKTGTLLNSTVQPRLLVSYIFNDRHKISGAFSRMVQPIHLLTNSGIGMPSDQWVPATKKIPSQTSNQFSLGYVWFLGNRFSCDMEIYHKDLENVIEYKEGADLINTNVDWQEKVEVGAGQAYGMEILFKKNYGNLTGWCGYAISKSTRKFENINSGNTFPFKYDRRNDFKLLLVYTPSDKINISGGWIFMGGSWVTMPTLVYPLIGDEASLDIWDFYTAGVNVDETQIDYVPSRNNIQMKPYHRLDAGISFKKQKTKHSRIWNISIYNVYARQNPLFYYYETNSKGQRKIKQFSLFLIIPTISYEINF